jgi:hypothetical protein
MVNDDPTHAAVKDWENEGGSVGGDDTHESDRHFAFVFGPRIRRDSLGPADERAGPLACPLPRPRAVHWIHRL